MASLRPVRRVWVLRTTPIGADLDGHIFETKAEASAWMKQLVEALDA